MLYNLLALQLFEKNVASDEMKGHTVDKEMWVADLTNLLEQKAELPKYQILADAVTLAIESGRLGHDTKLPTVRELATKLGISGTTVATAYRMLAQQQLISGKVGSGTRVLGASFRSVKRDSVDRKPTLEVAPVRSLWRRRTQTNHIAALSKAFPSALNCAAGLPNPTLLPLEVLRRGWMRAATHIGASDLQYGGPTPVPALSQQLLRKLEQDKIAAIPADLVIGSSAQQLMFLAVQIASERFQEAQLLVGVEEPGYPTLFDTYERLGHQLIGIEVDDEGAVPASVDNALTKGARLLVFTPRAHNPTGVSWSPSRLAALAELLAEYPDVIIIEDDQFADAANSQVGSLLNDPKLEDRVIYIRSFSKVVAPDLRLTLAVARPSLRTLLMEAKFYTDGWNSRFSQHALAHAFADEEMATALEAARDAYNQRRQGFTEALLRISSPRELQLSPACDGVNVWLELKNGTSAAEVAERAAAAGILVAVGEPFFVNVGRDSALRVNVGMVLETELVSTAGKLYGAFKQASKATPALFEYHSL